MKKMIVFLAALVMIPGAWIFAEEPSTSAEAGESRRIRSEVAPVFPDLARQMNISGVVKVRVVVDPEGRVVSAQEIGGHPLLIPSALTAAKKFRFESGPRETTQVIQFKYGQPR